VRPQAGRFAQHRDIDVDHLVVELFEQVIRALQQLQRVGVLPLRIGRREMRSNVAQSRRAEQRIGQRMCNRIRIGVSVQPAFVRDLDAGQDQLPARRKAMGIVSDAYAHGRNIG
jgi:hypothetical protein